MTHMKKLSYILIAGPSGSGKDTAVNHIIKDNDSAFEAAEYEKSKAT